MNILVTGSSGLIGSALVSLLTTSGHSVVRLVRSPRLSKERIVTWNPSSGVINTAELEGLDAVVHLAGEGIASGRWRPEKKARIRESRVRGTRLLCESIVRLVSPPKVLICASAIGYYGNRSDEVLTEESCSGSGFLAEVCREWESATEPVVGKRIRVVNLRIGVVLSPAGGALAMMLKPFQLGLGGKLGRGNQYVSWIAIEDLVSSIYHVLMTNTLQGAVNAVAPNPVTNLQLTKVLGRLLSRPTLFPVPAFLLQLMFGEFANEGLLASARVIPSKLLNTGYHFRYPNLEEALRHLLMESKKR